MPSMREDVYRVYLEFLETAEKKRRWNIFEDIPWNELESEKATDVVRRRVEIYCAEEMYVPDYSAAGLRMTRGMFGMAWFQALWAFEESRHGLAFREYLTRSGLRTEAEFAALEANVFASQWRLPFDRSRQMICYGALQEGATYAAYKLQRDCARARRDAVLEAVFFLVGRDEAAHAGFYRSMIELELAADRAGTIADLANVFYHFKMPGDGLIRDYRRRLRDSGAGISPRLFLEGVVMPLLTTLKIGRGEFRAALHKQTVENFAAAS